MRRWFSEVAVGFKAAGEEVMHQPRLNSLLLPQQGLRLLNRAFQCVKYRRNGPFRASIRKPDREFFNFLAAYCSECRTLGQQVQLRHGVPQSMPAVASILFREANRREPSADCVGSIS